MSTGYPSIRDIAVLQQATELILSSHELDTVLHYSVLVVRNYFGASRCAVFLLDDATGELCCRAHNGYEAATAPSRLPVDSDGAPQRAARSRSLVYLRDVEPGHGSELALPLMVRDHILGVLEITGDTPDTFSEPAISLLSVFAAQAAIAMENANLHSTALRRTRQIELMNLIARSAACATHTQQFFLTLADLLGDAFEGARVAIVLRGSQGISVAATSANHEPELERFRASQASGILAEAFAQRTVVLQSDVNTWPDWPGCFPGTRTELCAPLLFMGEALGAIVLSAEQANFFTADDRALAQAVADVCATATKNVQLAEELHRVANLDFLTGCHNQRFFYAMLTQEVARARRYNKSFGAVMFDLRGFRQINARYGLDAGDELLRKVVQRLRAHLRSNDVLCRYMGDRFVAVLPEIDRAGMDSVIAKIGAAARSITLPDRTSQLGLACASVACPHDGTSEPELVNLLLTRLEAAKKQQIKVRGQSSGRGA